MPAVAPASPPPACLGAPRSSLDGWAAKSFARAPFRAPTSGFTTGPRLRGTTPFCEHSAALREE
eukprot:6866157-Prymnesium_polylepis.1